ncbi:ly6/PLAUR domain-containing protein 2-like [Patiria miniata]|uniref:Snake toxin/toxin-like domain-containing protein n=1 Tax=Patiria miniata TaxID=46514 RepID=A0A913ZQ20_PATMI|nr:ly6/PLAUR domain-containing protein 2-like [Patiria miniata]
MTGKRSTDQLTVNQLSSSVIIINSKMKGLLCALVLATCVAGLFAVECYSCASTTSAGDANCLDPFNATSQPTTSCSGECTKTVGTQGDVTVIARSCAPACAEGCASAAGVEACIYCCTSDRCNGASSVTFGLITICVTVLAGWITSA